MPVFEGNLSKMRGTVSADGSVTYVLKLSADEVPMSDLIGQKLNFEFSGQINCISCGKTTRKSFAQGFCFNCMQTAPEASECVLRPALCKAHVGVSRDADWAQMHCLQPHYVYLANTGEIKVGVTRQSQIPVRWIDQGASAAIKICKTPNRHMAGLVEMHLSKHFTDKTLWKKMVSGTVDEALDLLKFRKEAIELLSSGMQQFVDEDDSIYSLKYPVQKYPIKPVTVTFDKERSFSGTLSGIRGQYLLFEDEQVLNIRRHNGYRVSLSY
ncbi:DUF2797 domain-containing protein [Alkalitalea saponilacus]|uniref:DUF2797 domain-containing protein n=1 Tax=Alkalitalea saponilacus TaxID=889453 RepID=A0A1T5EDB4_9BACT|nr:DUF2797 domain-containing protein [Alkalitalea saponilacus]ASB49015.1 hypothetical protein CDL62_07630 [Alkalitalea saponilacus]SKB82097.1 Protein of unknown function [Alkalitalea saponilacus]